MPQPLSPTRTAPISWILIALSFLAAYALRLAFGLFVAPVQPMEDEIQTYLLGLKYFTTGEWPYYGNDVITPPENLLLQGQDPGALEALLVGLPLKVCPSPLAPFFFVNLLSMAGYCFLAFYAVKRLPRLSPWFIFPWLLTAPWCIHYSTSMMNLSFSIAASCFFFVAFMESFPPLSLGWIAPWRANALMGFTLGAWMQLHRTWVLMIPFLLLSFYFQWKKTRRLNSILAFFLGILPMLALLVPTFFRPDYQFQRDVHGMSMGFNPHNFKSFFAILLQYLALAGFEMPRFIGISTHGRLEYLASHWYLWSGFLIWTLSFVQIAFLLGFGFDRKNPAKGWNLIRAMAGLAFFLIYGALLFTIKNPDVNTFCEMLPVVMLYSLYVWNRLSTWAWGRIFRWAFLLSGLAFQVGYVFARAPLKESLYLKYGDAMAKAIEAKDYHLLGERRPGALY
jgi:hypothetical protein